jgi:uncharacterized protein with HEPN domain
MALDPNERDAPAAGSTPRFEPPTPHTAPDDAPTPERDAAPASEPQDAVAPEAGEASDPAAVEEPATEIREAGAAETREAGAAEAADVPDEAPAAATETDPGATEEWVPDDHDDDRPTEVSPARDPELERLRDATFPVVWRGYDAHAVDAYKASVERALERFEERMYPTVAVQRALDRIGEQTASILQQAEETADETTRTSRAQADDRLQRAEREAAEVQAGAIARVRSLDDDIERLWQERQRLIDATKELADRLRATALDAESRFPPAETAPPFDAAADPPTRERLPQDEERPES